MPALKVFCIDCRYLRMARQKGSAEAYRCNKARTLYVDSWLEHKPRKETPWEKNADNDCPDYKHKTGGGS